MLEQQRSGENVDDVPFAASVICQIAPAVLDEAELHLTQLARPRGRGAGRAVYGRGRHLPQAIAESGSPSRIIRAHPSMPYELSLRGRRSLAYKIPYSAWAGALVNLISLK